MFSPVLRTPAIFVFAVVLAAAGCGRKGMPLPPEIRVADTTRDLKVVQLAETARLEWSYPQMTTAGGPLPDLEKIEVWRAEVPVAQEPRGTTSRDRQIRVSLVEARGEVIVVLEDEGLALASRGAGLVVEDKLARWLEGDGDNQLVLLYAVRSVCCRGRRSELSNVVRLVPSEPPAPPSGLVVTADPDGLQLEWSSVTGQLVRVERSDDGDHWLEATTEPVAEASWVDRDIAQGATWFYRLRSLLVGEGGVVVHVGLPGPVVRAKYPDIYPPEQPQELVCLPEGGRVRLRWRSSVGASAYRIERAGGGEKLTLVENLAEVFFIDEEPPTGNVVYFVRSLDEAGNRSDSVSCATVVESPR
ncbi:MAG: hypothetical protein K8R59_16815 [Thermoanaerobaculales bacterium]|nr:hypothetical protein [Thermoanaerobaculales bacterium]